MQDTKYSDILGSEIFAAILEFPLSILDSLGSLDFNWGSELDIIRYFGV